MRRADALTTAAALAAALLFIPLVVPVMTGRLFSLGDLTDFHAPMRFVYASALKAGDSFLWSPALFAGFYAHGEGQLGMLHPFHLFLYRFLPLTIACNVELIASYAAAFAGMYLLLGRARLSTGARLLGAIAFAFSGFNLMHLLHVNMIAVAVHTPWLLLGVDVMLTSTRPAARAGGFLLFAGSLASAILLGFPQCLWMASLVVGGFTIARAGSLGAWRRVGWVTASAVAGIMMGAAQLLPTLDLASHSARQQVTTAFGLSYSLHPLNVVQLWSPYVFPDRSFAPADEPFPHEFAIYDGAFCAIALAWVIARRRALEHPKLAAAGLALCGAGLILAFGRYAGVYTLLRHLPWLEYFRAPARHILLVHLGLALLAAVAIDDLDGLSRGRGHRGTVRRGLVAVAAVTVLSVATALMALAFEPPSADLLLGVAVFVVTGALVLVAARGHRWAAICLPFCLAADLGVWGYRYVWNPAPMTIAQMAALVDVPQTAARGDRLFLSRWSSIDNVVVLRGYRRLSGYAGLTPRKQLPATDPMTQRIAGVTWALVDDEWIAVGEPMPRARVVTNARATAHPEDDVGDIDISLTALVSHDVGPLTGAPAAAAVRVDRPGHLEIDAGGGGRRLLVTTESYDPGWRATGAGRTLATEPVYGDFLGVIVPPEVARVRLVFDPWSTRAGVRVSFAGLALATLAALAISRKTAT